MHFMRVKKNCLKISEDKLHNYTSHSRKILFAIFHRYADIVYATK